MIVRSQPRDRGMTLIDVIVGSALVLIVFLALLGVLRASILISQLAKARAGAASLADSQMEYLRGLSYDALGTVGGIPAGNIPQDTTETVDGTSYDVHTLIEYVDDPADGTGANDTNGITTDYKIAKVTVSYTAAGKSRTAVLMSNFAPPGIETTSGGGTLVVHVVNASGAPVPGATVRIVNTAITPTVDLSTFSDANGSVELPGAATSTAYQVYVSEAGYSSAQTYARDTTNQNPSPGYLTVVENQTTTGTFAIDTLAALTLRTYGPPTPGSFSDTFNDESQLVATSSVDAVGGALELSGSALSGSATSTQIAPTALDAWGSLSAELATSTGASVAVHVYDSAGSLLPDSVLPGNATGFTSFPVSLSGVSTSTYPALSLGATLSTSATTIVPKVLDWTLGYTVGASPVPNVPFTIVGTKTVGSTGSGTPIYKTDLSTTTNAYGTRTLSLEWDAYTPTISGYDVTDACDAPPYALAPGTAQTETLTLGPATTNSLLVTVTDANGVLVPGASVTLSRSGYTKNVTASACGAAYFGGVGADTDYTVTISKSGYTSTSFTAVGVSGQTSYIAAFP